MHLKMENSEERKVPGSPAKNTGGDDNILWLRERQEPFQEQVQENNWSTSAKLALPDHKGKCSSICVCV